MLQGKDVLLGAIDVASDRVETPEEVAATIEQASRFRPGGPALPLHQLRHGADGTLALPAGNSTPSAPARGSPAAPCKRENPMTVPDENPATDLFEIIRTTRSMRRLKPDPVPNELIRKILEAGVCAPSGGNMQRWRFLVVRDPKVKETVGALYKRAWDEQVGPTVSVG